MRSMVNGRRGDRTAHSRMIISYGGPLDRGTLMDGRSGLPLLRFMNPEWHVDHRGSRRAFGTSLYWTIYGF